MSSLEQSMTISALTSLLVSSIFGILSLIVAIRIGKERSDRSSMRSLYKSLYDHFNEMNRKFAKGEPAQWSDFPMLRDKYYPAVRELERTGDINLLPKYLADDFLNVEKTALFEAHHYKEHVETYVTPKLLQIIEASTVPPLSFKQGQPYIAATVNLLAIGGEAYAEQLKSRLSTSEKKGLSIGIPESRGINTKYIRPDSLNNIDMEIFINLLSEQATEAMGDFKTRIKTRQEDIERILPIIAKRIRDPHPFSETISGIFRDLVDQSSR